jgi:L-ribulose-5-phosphate 3-epimerase
MLQLGAATFTYLNRFGFEESLDHLAELGFKYLELMSTPPHFFPRDMSSAKRIETRRAIEARGLTLYSLQPTYMDLNIISLNRAIRAESIKQVKENLELAGELGAKLLVLVTGRRHVLLPAPLNDCWKLALEAIRECNETARRSGVKIGIENVRNQFVDRGTDVKRMIDDLADDNIKGVIDVANANVVEDPLEAIDPVKNDLILIHLSDNDGQAWTHSTVGEGKIDFQAVADKIREIGYNGPCILEVTDIRDPKGAMTRSKQALAKFGFLT